MDKFVERFKKLNKISHKADDDTILTDILNPSKSDIIGLVGDFDPDKYEPGLELIFNRARYAYNDQLEFFYDNFQQRIMDISFELSGGEKDGD